MYVSLSSIHLTVSEPKCQWILTILLTVVSQRLHAAQDWTAIGLTVDVAAFQ